jgi:uncharacterized protein
MKIDLTQRPQNVTIIEGFPGLGLVGTIATEYLLDHLDVKKIGSVWFSEMNPMVAIHNKKIIEPLGIFYNKKNNLVILHALTNVKGVEWKLADSVCEIAKKLKAKEIISLEGVATKNKIDTKDTYYFGGKSPKKWEKMGLSCLNEGVVIGVTASLMLKLNSIPMSCIFTETSAGLPDSRAAAKMIELLDKYLNLNVDYVPLVKKAKDFENKIKGIIKNTEKIKKIKSHKQEISYMG